MAKLILTLIIYLMFFVISVAVVIACEAAMQYIADVPFIRRILCSRAGTC